MDKKGKIINEHPAETLSKQYASVWSEPKDHLKIHNIDFFMDLSNEERPTLEYISINRMKIRKAIFNFKKWGCFRSRWHWTRNSENIL